MLEGPVWRTIPAMRSAVSAFHSSLNITVAIASIASLLLPISVIHLSESFNYTVPVDISRLFTAELCRIARGDSVDALLVVYVVVPPRITDVAAKLAAALQ